MRLAGLLRNLVEFVDILDVGHHGQLMPNVLSVDIRNWGLFGPVGDSNSGLVVSGEY